MLTISIASVSYRHSFRTKIPFRLSLLASLNMSRALPTVYVPLIQYAAQIVLRHRVRLEPFEQSNAILYKWQAIGVHRVH